MTAEPRRRGPRRADAAGTGPASADGPEPVLEPQAGAGTAIGGVRTAASADASPAPAEVEHDRWLREQRPPHWG